MLLDKELEEARDEAWPASRAASRSASWAVLRSAYWSGTYSETEKKKQVEMIREVLNVG